MSKFTNNENLSLTELMRRVGRDNLRWWQDLETGAPANRNVGEMLCLVHSEISEAMEGHRRGLNDDHLPHRDMFVVELADAVIRILDIAYHLCPELPEVLVEKLDYNLKRRDHTREARLEAGGKRY